MKQIAVEWLYNHLFPKQLDGFSDEEWSKIDLAFEKAKQMEKQEKDQFAIGFAEWIFENEFTYLKTEYIKPLFQFYKRKNKL